jgi:GDP-D-mannose dehydratase
LAEKVKAVAGDVGNFSHVLDVVKACRPRVIYHLGAMLSAPSDADPASAIQTNAMGTFYILE